MSVIHGKDGSTQLVVDGYAGSARVTERPMPLGARGAYSLSLTTGIIPAALTANSEIFQFRFVDPTVAGRLLLLRTIRVSASVSTTMFAAGVPVQLEAKVARGWTAQGTGGTGITFGANDAKKRTNMGTTLLGAGDVRVATTAALGAGTKTLDGTAFASCAAGGPITGSLAGTIIPAFTRLWQRDTGDEYPFVLAHQEGFVVTVPAVPATGTWTATVSVDWAEIDPAVIDGWA